ncbi:MAG: DMT family transporter [Gammaproteobacteria bacterium]
MNKSGEKNKISRRRAEIMLVAATFFWGWTFPVVREAVAGTPVFAFLALRFALAAAFMTPFVRRPPPLRAWRFGGALGALLFLLFALQTWGLVFTSSANSAFITGLNVIWVFLLTPGGRRRGWLPLPPALAGLWLLTAPEAGAFNFGDFLTLLCSLCVAMHILLLARMDASRDSGELALIQFLVVAAASAALSAATETFSRELDGDLIFALLLTAGGATVFSFWVQTHFQRYTTARRAGLIFICEPLFAAVFAAGFYGETLPAAAWPGAVLMLSAMLWAVWRGEKA